MLCSFILTDDCSNLRAKLKCCNHSRLLNAMEECNETVEDNINFDILVPLLKTFSEDEKVHLKSTDKKGTSLIDSLKAKSETEFHDLMKSLDDSGYYGHHVILQDLHEKAIKFPITTV